MEFVVMAATVIRSVVSVTSVRYVLITIYVSNVKKKMFIPNILFLRFVTQKLLLRLGVNPLLQKVHGVHGDEAHLVVGAVVIDSEEVITIQCINGCMLCEDALDLCLVLKHTIGVAELIKVKKEIN